MTTKSTESPEDTPSPEFKTPEAIAEQLASLIEHRDKLWREIGDVNNHRIVATNRTLRAFIVDHEIRDGSYCADCMYCRPGGEGPGDADCAFTLYYGKVNGLTGKKLTLYKDCGHKNPDGDCPDHAYRETSWLWRVYFEYGLWACVGITAAALIAVGFITMLILIPPGR